MVLSRTEKEAVIVVTTAQTTDTYGDMKPTFIQT